MKVETLVVGPAYESCGDIARYRYQETFFLGLLGITKPPEKRTDTVAVCIVGRGGTGTLCSTADSATTACSSTLDSVASSPPASLLPHYLPRNSLCMCVTTAADRHRECSDDSRSVRTNDLFVLLAAIHTSRFGRAEKEGRRTISRCPTAAVATYIRSSFSANRQVTVMQKVTTLPSASVNEQAFVAPSAVGPQAPVLA